MKSWWVLLKDAAANWSKHKDARQGAALAYYSIFSLGPLMVIAIAIAGLVFGQDAVRGEVGSQLKELLGEAGAQAVEIMLQPLSNQARDNVVRKTGGKADDDVHRPCGVGLRACGAQGGRERGGTRCQMQKIGGVEVSSCPP